AHFGSKHSSEQSGKRWGMDIYGSRGVIAIRASHIPEIYYTETITWTNAAWKPLPIPAGTLPRTNLEANHLLVRDLVDAIEQNREPAAGGRAARWTIEMAMALYESELTGKRVALPLINREHPLA
ncbi:MAG: hypothetical protein GY953_09160, partial [bacterium]|nr:hypothetical protein [bacterium]